MNSNVNELIDLVDLVKEIKNQVVYELEYLHANGDFKSYETVKVAVCSRIGSAFGDYLSDTE